VSDPLTRADFQTRTWDRLAAHLEARLAAHRADNDNRLDEVKTATLRGRIAEIKELLALAQEPAPAQEPPGSASTFDAFPRA
jgi:hypothetical protein